MGFFSQQRRYKKELKHSRGLKKASLLLRFAASSITTKSEYMFGCTALVNNFYLIADDTMNKTGMANAYDNFVSRLETDAAFENMIITRNIGVVMGAACVMGQWGEKKGRDVFWSEELKKISIRPEYIEDIKKIYDLTVKWCEEGMVPFMPEGGLIANALLGSNDFDGISDPTHTMALTVGIHEAMKMYRQMVALDKMSSARR